MTIHLDIPLKFWNVIIFFYNWNKCAFKIYSNEFPMLNFYLSGINLHNYECTCLWPPDEKRQLIGKDHDAEKDWEQKEKGATEGEMGGWHHWLNGHEFEQAPWDSEEQGSLAGCSPWGRRVWHDLGTEQQCWYPIVSMTFLFLLLFFPYCVFCCCCC